MSQLEFRMNSSKPRVSRVPRSNTFDGDVSPVRARKNAKEGESLAYSEIKSNRTIPEPIRSHFKPPRTKSQIIAFLFARIPIIGWLWTYRPKYLIGDVITGITIGVTHIPQAIGFALLANVNVVYGLYSSFLPPLVYAIFGSSRHISVGTFPVLSLLVGQAVLRITEEAGCQTPTQGITETDIFSSNKEVLECETIGASVAVTLAFMAGIIMILAGLLQLGFVTLFLSDPLISGYTCAAAFTILITQLNSIFGIGRKVEPITSNGVKIGSYFQNIRRLILFFHDLVLESSDKARNWPAFGYGIICIIFLLIMDKVNKLLQRKIKSFPIIIPSQLIVVIVATAISFGIRLDPELVLDNPNNQSRGGVAITGPIDKGGPPSTVNMLSFSILNELIADAFVIAIIGYVINISQAKLFARKSNYAINSNQEFLAYGFMNLFGSFAGSFPTAGALSRTVLQHTLGGNTQLVSIISSIVVILVLNLLTQLFTFLPIAALAAIIVTALQGLYLQVFDLKRFFKLSIYDGCVWAVVFTSTFIIGLDIGLLIGVIFSLGVILVYTILPHSAELGVAKTWDPEFFKYSTVERIKGICIFRFSSPLYFANAPVFKAQLAATCGLEPKKLSEEKKEGFVVLFDRIKKDGCRGGCCARYNVSEEGRRDSLLTYKDSSSKRKEVPESLELENGEEDVKTEKEEEQTFTSDPESSALSKSEASSVRRSTYSTTKSSPTNITRSKTIHGSGSSRRTSKFISKSGVHTTDQIEEVQDAFKQLSSESKSNIKSHGSIYKYHTVIIDCTPITFVDGGGVEAILQTVKDYDDINIQVLLASPTPYMLTLLRRASFFELFGSDWIFPSINAAVEFARAGKKVRVEFVQEALDLLFLNFYEKQCTSGRRYNVSKTVSKLAKKVMLQSPTAENYGNLGGVHNDKRQRSISIPV